jgi:hypothetical protein
MILSEVSCFSGSCVLYLLRVVALRGQGARDLSRRIDWGRDGWLRPRDMEKARGPILSTDCARLPDLSFVAPLQMEMGTVSTDAAAGVSHGLDKGPLPCTGEGGRARPAARHIDGAGAGGGVVTGSDRPPLIVDVSSRPTREPEKSGCGRSRTTAAGWLGVATSSRRRLGRSRADESVVQGCSRSPQRRDAHQVHFTRRRAWQRSRSSI